MRETKDRILANYGCTDVNKAKVGVNNKIYIMKIKISSCISMCFIWTVFRCGRDANLLHFLLSLKTCTNSN
jgi:hypothetical protein